MSSVQVFGRALVSVMPPPMIVASGYKTLPTVCYLTSDNFRVPTRSPTRTRAR